MALNIVRHSLLNRMSYRQFYGRCSAMFHTSNWSSTSGMTSSPVNEQHQKNWRHFEYRSMLKTVTLLASTALGLLAGYRTVYCESAPHHDNDDNEEDSDELEQYGKHLDTLPNYRRSEVAQHNKVEKSVWITYRHGVYDITDYIEAHPGGQTINWGLGRAMEPFFDKFSIHNEPHVLAILESMRVGNVHPEDMTPEALKKTFHNPTPMNVNMSQYRLVVSGKGFKSLLPTNFTIADLKGEFKTHVVLQPPRPGSNNTRYTKLKGVKLRDVIEYRLFTPDTVGQVELQSLGTDYKGNAFKKTLTPAEAFDDSVLLIFEADRKPLNPFQGAPIMLWNPKAKGPPFKWVHKIIISS